MTRYPCCRHVPWIVGSVAVIWYLTTVSVARAQDLESAIEAFWTVEDAAVESVVEDLLAEDPGIEPLWRGLRAGPGYDAAVPRGRQLFSRTSADGVEYRYEVYIPEAYDPTLRYPVRVYLHGGVSRPRRESAPFWRNGEQYVRDDTIVVFPESWGEAMWWQANQIENLGGILNDIKRRYNVNENAVHLMGVSDGATGAFYHAFKAATPWASILSFNGHPVVLANPATEADGQMYVTNLRNKPVLAINGGQDRLYPVTSVLPFFQLFVDAGVYMDFTPKPDAGHNMQWWAEESSNIDDFIVAQNRRPLPDQLVWETESTTQFNRLHWLVITELGAVEGETEFDDFNEITPPPQGVPIGFNRLAELAGGGLQLVDVIEGSLADDAGVQPGDLLVEVNGVPIRTLDDLRRAVQMERDGPGLPLSVERAGEIMAFALIPPETLPVSPPRQAFPRSMPSGRVQLLRTGNRVGVVTRGVRRYTLLLSPEQFDFTEPIQITTNGVMSFEGMVEPDSETLLRWAARDRDRTMLFGARLDIDVRAR